MSKAEKTKQFIIEKTAPIFNQKGYAGTSINDLTEATGLSKGGIYGNFINKDAVAVAAFDHNYGALRKAIKERMDEKDHPIDKLKVHLTVFSDMPHLTHLKYGCPILNTAIEADDTHEDLRKRASHAIDNWYKSISDIIKQGQDNGQIQPAVNHQDFAGAYIALLEGGIMLTKVTGKKHGLDAAIKQATKMLAEISI